MNETVLMIMLVAIMVFFFIFGMIGLEKSKKNGGQDAPEAEPVLDEAAENKEV